MSEAMEREIYEEAYAIRSRVETMTAYMERIHNELIGLRRDINTLLVSREEGGGGGSAPPGMPSDTPQEKGKRWMF